MIADRLIAHRGCSLRRPENTLEALRHTADIGTAWVEIDANLLGDGTVVMFHDDVLNRLSNGTGSLSGCQWADVEELDVGTHFHRSYHRERLPRLADAVALTARLGLGLNLEIKVYPHFRPADIIPPVLTILQEQWVDYDRLIISSFSTEALRLVRASHPDWQLGQLWETIPDDWEVLADELGLVSIHCDYRWLRSPQIEEIRRKGLDIYCYTVNDAAAGASLLEAGVDGLITDDPLLYPQE